MEHHEDWQERTVHLARRSLDKPVRFTSRFLCDKTYGVRAFEDGVVVPKAVYFRDDDRLYTFKPELASCDACIQAERVES